MAEQPEGDGQFAAPTNAARAANAANAASDRLLTRLDKAFWLLLIVYGVCLPFLVLMGIDHLVDLQSIPGRALLSVVFLALVVASSFLAVRGLQLAWGASPASGVRLARRTSRPRAYGLAWAWCGAWTAFVLLLLATAVWFADALAGQLDALVDAVGVEVTLILVLALGVSPLLAWGPLVVHWISQRGRKRREHVMPA